MDGDGDRLDRRLVGPMVFGFVGGGDSFIFGGVAEEAHEEADSFSLIMESGSSVETDGNLLAANDIFFLRTQIQKWRQIQVFIVREGSIHVYYFFF